MDCSQKVSKSSGAGLLLLLTSRAPSTRGQAGWGNNSMDCSSAAGRHGGTVGTPTSDGAHHGRYDGLCMGARGLEGTGMEGGARFAAFWRCVELMWQHVGTAGHVDSWSRSIVAVVTGCTLHHPGSSWLL